MGRQAIDEEEAEDEQGKDELVDVAELYGEEDDTRCEC